MSQKIYDEFTKLLQVEAIAVEGEKNIQNGELKEYDVYVYYTGTIPEETRAYILRQNCRCIEVGNRFGEYEDNCILFDGTSINLVYRKLEEYITDISDVVDKYNAKNGYTTCKWFNLINSEIIFDRNGKLKRFQERYSVKFPMTLKKNIINNNLKLLSGTLPSFDRKINNALVLNDLVGVNRWVAKFLGCYFDIIFAINEIPQPCKKNIIDYSMQNCTILPNDFEANLTHMFDDMFVKGPKGAVCIADIERIVTELKLIIKNDEETVAQPVTLQTAIQS